MSLITIDFETYYTDKIGFKTLTTEEYIRHRKFEVIGVGVKIDEQEPIWITRQIKEFLQALNWKDSALLCHNTLFDGAILNWIYGIKPEFYLDTLCMARALHGVDAGGSLKALAERYNIGAKGEEVLAAKDKRQSDFTAEELARYGEYCKNDVELTHKLFHIMAPNFPSDEVYLLSLIHI